MTRRRHYAACTGLRSLRNDIHETRKHGPVQSRSSEDGKGCGGAQRHAPAMRLRYNSHCLSLKTPSYSPWRAEAPGARASVFPRAREPHKAGVGKRDVHIPGPSGRGAACGTVLRICLLTCTRIDKRTARPPRGLV